MAIDWSASLGSVSLASASLGVASSMGVSTGGDDGDDMGNLLAQCQAGLNAYLNTHKAKRRQQIAAADHAAKKAMKDAGVALENDLAAQADKWLEVMAKRNAAQVSVCKALNTRFIELQQRGEAEAQQSRARTEAAVRTAVGEMDKRIKRSREEHQDASNAAIAEYNACIEAADHKQAKKQRQNKKEFLARLNTLAKQIVSNDGDDGLNF